MICELTGMDVANSSMYDGGTALAEAAMLAAGHTRKKKFLYLHAVHPESRAVLETYAKGQHLEVVEINHKDGVTDLDVLQSEVDDTVACVIVSISNFFGQVEKLADIEKLFINKNHYLSFLQIHYRRCINTEENLVLILSSVMHNHLVSQRSLVDHTVVTLQRRKHSCVKFQDVLSDRL